MAEAIEMLFASRTRVGPGKRLMHIANGFKTNTVLCSFYTIQPSSIYTNYFIILFTEKRASWHFDV